MSTQYLTGIDTDSIIEQARTEDNRSNRIRKIKELLFKETGIQDTDQLYLHFDFTWRATRRTCEVLLANVRELPDESLRSQGDEWKVIFDYPFDEEGHTPQEDLERLARFRAHHPQGSRTLVWLPSFLSRQSQKDLGLLVILDYILMGDRLSSYVAHLSPADRSTARTILENQRSQLKQRLITILEGIYGIGRAVTGSVDMSSDFGLADHFQSLDPGLMLQPPVSARFQDGFLTLLDQALTHQFPGHPQFDSDAKLSLTVLKRVYQEVERAIQHPEGRIEVEKDRRRELRQIVNPLKIGEMTTETHFVLGHHWPSHFLKKEAEHGGPITVARLRRWMDEPQVMGLPTDLQNLIILVFASQTNRFFALRATTVTPAVESLTNEMELREQQLPDESDWKKARERASQMLNLDLAQLRNATNLNKAIEHISKLVQGEKPLIEKLVTNLENAVRVLQLDPATVTRLQTAQAARTLINQLSTAKSKSVIETLARFELTVSDAAITACLHRAEAVNAAFEKIEWSIFDAVNQRSDQGQPAAQALLAGLKEALKTDEHVTELATFLKNVFRRAVNLLAETSTSLPTQPLGSLPSPSSTALPGTSSLVPDRSSPPTTHMLGSGGYSTRLGTPVPLSTAPVVAPRPLSLSGLGTQSIQEKIVSNETELQPVLQELRSWVSKHPGKKLRITWEDLDA